METGIVTTGRQGRFRTFEVVERDRAIRLLITYRSSIADAWVERLLETWSELFRT